MDQYELIQRAWALTEAIEAAASAEDWARAAELTEARSSLLMRLHGEQSAESIAIVRRIQASIESMMGRSQDAQAMLATAYRKSTDQAQAAARYQKAAWL